MTTRRTRFRLIRVSRALAAGASATLAATLVVSACGSNTNLVGAGGECFLATDCAPGLVCIEQSNKARICSADLSRVTGERPADAASSSDAESTDGAVADVSRPTDSSKPDANKTPDTGTPPVDAAPDTGAPPVDAGNG